MRFHKKISGKFKKGLTSERRKSRLLQRNELLKKMLQGGKIHSRAIDLFEKNPSRDIRQHYSQSFSKSNKKLLTLNQRRKLIKDLKKLSENYEHLIQGVKNRSINPKKILLDFLTAYGFGLHKHIAVKKRLAGNKGLILKSQEQLVKLLAKPGVIVRVADSKIRDKINPFGLVFVMDKKTIKELSSLTGVENREYLESFGFASMLFIDNKVLPFSIISEEIENSHIEKHEKEHMIDMLFQEELFDKNPKIQKRKVAIGSFKKELIAELNSPSINVKNYSITNSILELEKLEKQQIITKKELNYYKQIIDTLNKLLISGYSRKTLASIIRTTPIQKVGKRFEAILKLEKQK